jgi:ABC-2 type transport system permease protein
VVYWELFKKSFRIQYQYRFAHLINNLGSLLFGFIYIAMWLAILQGKEGRSPYSVREMLDYIAFSQCLLWVVAFVSQGLGIQFKVRTGMIAVEMARPLSFYLSVLASEAGKVAYNVLFRCLPLGAAFAWTTGFYVPERLLTLVYAALSVLMAMWISFQLNYLIGIISCWTWEVRWAHLITHTLLFGLGGQFVPVSLLPAVLARLAEVLPFSQVLYVPVSIWLEKNAEPAGTMLLVQALWGIMLTLVSLGVTRLAERKLEIQGG